jgi:hypothetical protein
MVCGISAGKKFLHQRKMMFSDSSFSEVAFSQVAGEVSEWATPFIADQAWTDAVPGSNSWQNASQSSNIWS